MFVKTLFAFLICFAVMQFVVSASEISRTIIVNGTVVQVRFDVFVDGETYYAIDDVYPNIILNSCGDFNCSEAYHAKIAVTEAVNTSLYYYLNLPIVSINTTYLWSGTYMMEGMTEPAFIIGDVEFLIVANVTIPDDVPEAHQVPSQAKELMFIVSIFIAFAMGLYAVNELAGKTPIEKKAQVLIVLLLVLAVLGIVSRAF